MRQRYGVALAENSVGRLLKELGFAPVSARTRRPRQDPEANEIRKKPIRPEKAAELWFADETRIAQKNSPVYQWIPRGTRPTPAGRSTR